MTQCVQPPKMRKKRASVFDVYKEQIIEMLRYRSSIPFIAREINKEGKVEVSATGLMAYIKRENLMPTFPPQKSIKEHFV